MSQRILIFDEAILTVVLMTSLLKCISGHFLVFLVKLAQDIPTKMIIFDINSIHYKLRRVENAQIIFVYI